MKTLSLFFLATLGLYLPLHGQVAAFSENEAAEKAPNSYKSENLLGQVNSASIGTLINNSDMTITQSYQSETQSTADIGASFDIAQIDKDLRGTLENDETLWSQTKKEESIVRSRIFALLNIILVIMAALIVLSLKLIHIRSKRSKYYDLDTSV